MCPSAVHYGYGMHKHTHQLNISSIFEMRGDPFFLLVKKKKKQQRNLRTYI